jgi:hypothetical protein
MARGKKEKRRRGAGKTRITSGGCAPTPPTAPPTAPQEGGRPVSLQDALDLISRVGKLRTEREDAMRLMDTAVNLAVESRARDRVDNANDKYDEIVDYLMTMIPHA